MTRPVSRVNNDALELSAACGLGMGDRANGLRQAANSLKLKLSKMLRAVARVPPEGAALERLAVNDRHPNKRPMKQSCPGGC